ncbi:MAG: hypothetical protein JOZ37_19280 [Actinobacteria bacterium]|nr:hypothetical protein [Actinomycetota bacterium]MBV9256059.1 hypothetical protein [Actinomycetota bacterium]MBV9666114.1 hypothetical protein [Actinomycetota bacterium]MBV9933185.1 hypothetical protein [Actinomycetota bacterium]
MNADAALKRQFATAIVAALAVMIGLGGVIALANHGHHRPEGAAERWLTAVGDTTRKGVKADARDRADKLGGVSIGQPLLPTDDTKGKSAFPDLEVGKARVTAGQARVPYRLHQRAQHGKNPLKEGTMVLARSGEGWKVTSLDARQPGEKVPSDGGQPPSSAGLGLWLGAVGVGALVTVLIIVLVEWATRSSQRALAAS